MTVRLDVAAARPVPPTKAPDSVGARRRRSVIGHTGGADLSRAIHAAIRSNPAARALTEYERDGLAQSVAISYMTGKDRPRGSARAVLAWIDRAERMPVWAAREGMDAVPMDRERLRATLALRVSSVLAQRADWRDTADADRTRAMAQRGERAMIDRAHGPTDDGEGFLAQSVAHAQRGSAPLEIVPVHLWEVAQDAAAALTDRPADARRVACRLAQAAAVVAEINPAAVLADVAERTGRTLNAVRVDAARGGPVLADAGYAPESVADAMRDAMARHGARVAVWDRVELTREERAARTAVTAAQSASGWGGEDAAGIMRAVLPYPDAGGRERAPIHGPVAGAQTARAGIVAVPLSRRPARASAPRTVAQRPAPAPLWWEGMDRATYEADPRSWRAPRGHGRPADVLAWLARVERATA